MCAADAPAPPTGPDDITAPWLSSALAASTGGARVVELTSEAIGTGQVADTRRLTITWDPPGAGPSRLVAKVPSADPTSRQTARVTRTYAVEVGFYRDLADRVDVDRPACHHISYDEDADTFALVLDDLAPATQGDQLTGCSVDDASRCVRELVALHAPLWGDPSLVDLPWINRTDPVASGFRAQILATLLPGFLERFAELVDPDVLALTERVIPRIGPYLGERAGPHTVIHNDFRVDNLLFGDDRVAVVDWQTVSVGPGAVDLSYFLGGSLPVELRRAHERALVEEYREGLAARGIEVSPDRLWTDYRRYAFDGLLMAILASMVVVRTERGDAMFAAMATGAGRHALDLDAESLLS